MSTAGRKAQSSDAIGPEPTGTVHPLFVGFVDDAAVFPPGNAPLVGALAAHREHRAAWYAPLIGPLLLPASAVTGRALAGLIGADEAFAVGLVADDGLPRLGDAVAGLGAGAVLAQIEAAVAKRGEDPLPGLAELLTFAGHHPGLDLFAEVPLTWGLLGAVDAIARARADGVRITAKFRTGGLAAELFPSPVELAGVITACRDRSVPFKLTAGLHRGVRHHDPDTGFVHHGFVNILAAVIGASQGVDVGELGQLLASTDATALVELVAPYRAHSRPLWTGFGSCSVAEPLGELAALGLLDP